MSFSFVVWGMANFDQQNFILAGKTIGSLRRNVVAPLKRMLLGRGVVCIDHRADNMIEVAYLGRVNYFYLFGGKDESSQDLVQGITAAGAYFDEVALQPESFVNQAVGRCSVDGSKLWFNCNPESPAHWFKQKWIDKAKELGLYVMHFLMDDNPSLSEATKARYKQLYAAGSIFYKRYILGLWCIAEGAIYDMFDESKHVLRGPIPSMTLVSTGVDYGTANPTAFESCGYIKEGPHKGKWLFFKEFYHDPSKKRQKTDSELSQDMQNYLKDVPVQYINVDPSAASFKLQLKRDLKYIILDADNAVLDGIRALASAISQGLVLIHESCTHLIRQMQSYSWDPKAQEKGEDKPIKEDDHAVDAARYAFKKVSRIDIR